MGVSRVKIAAAETIVSWWKSPVRLPCPRRSQTPPRGAHTDNSAQTVLAARNERHAAATVIQGAFARFKAAVRATWDEVLYVHVRCHATADTDALYRTVLAEDLEAIRVTLNWLEVPKLSLGRNSILVRTLSSRRKSNRTTFVVLGSHGCGRCVCPRCPFESECAPQSMCIWQWVHGCRGLPWRRDSRSACCDGCEADARCMARIRPLHRRVLLDWRSIGTDLSRTRCRPAVHRRSDCRDPLGRGARSRAGCVRPGHRYQLLSTVSSRRARAYSEMHVLLAVFGLLGATPWHTRRRKEAPQFKVHGGAIGVPRNHRC